MLSRLSAGWMSLLIVVAIMAAAGWIVLTVRAARYFRNRHTTVLRPGQQVFCMGMAILNVWLFFAMLVLLVRQLRHFI